MSRALTLLFAAASGMAVANVYSAQPLLDALSGEFGLSRATVGIVITVTQLCYAIGLVTLVPLGDLLNRRRLILAHLMLTAGALAAVGTATASVVLLVGFAAVGLLAVVTQTLVAYASTLAAPAERGRVVGQVTSGIVLGILLARSFAGIMTDVAGWRSVYLLTAVLMLALSGVLYRMLPADNRPKPKIAYLQLLRSVFVLFAEERVLRIRAALALLLFFAFSTLWTPLVLPLSEPPSSLSHTAIGAFGLAGAAGALAAARAGRLADRGYGQRTTGIALVLLTASWLPIRYLGQSLPALIAGVIILDLAVQAVHVTNQTMIFRVRPDARSRLTAGYMTFYSIGSAAGSIASTRVYAHDGWDGVCLLGAAASALALFVWTTTRRLS